MATRVVNITGVDGIKPKYHKDTLWRIWSYDNIFMGEKGKNKYIPSVGDYVRKIDTFVTYKVESLDNVTLIPTLNKITPETVVVEEVDRTTHNVDILFGSRTISDGDTYRAYLDKSVTPHLLVVDSRIRIGGSDSVYAKIFKGTDVTNTGIVISKIYDNDNNIISENVPLELIAMENYTNHHIKRVSKCFVPESSDNELLDGEVITLVIYNQSGGVEHKRKLLLENTAFIRSLNVDEKYISHIALESSFLTNDDNIIDFPIGLSPDALDLKGIVYYSDGTLTKSNLNDVGSKFKIFGLDQLKIISNVRSVDLVLSYTLDDDETAYSGYSVNNNSNTTPDKHHISEPYTLRVRSLIDNHFVKLYGYPMWNTSTNLFELKWFIYNIRRNLSQDVTSLVTIINGSFDSTSTVKQTFTVSVNLNQVNPTFIDYTHTQNYSLTLGRRSYTTDYFAIDQNVWFINTGVNKTLGKNLYIERSKQNSRQVNLESGIDNFTEWYKRFYLDTNPIRLSSTNDPVVPTHLVLMVDDEETEIPMTLWNNDWITVRGGPNTLETMFIKFIKKVGANIEELSIIGTMIRYVR